MATYEGTLSFYCNICHVKYRIYTNYSDSALFLSEYNAGEKYMMSGGKHYPLSDVCPCCGEKMEGLQHSPIYEIWLEGWRVFWRYVRFGFVLAILQIPVQIIGNIVLPLLFKEFFGLYPWILILYNIFIQQPPCNKLLFYYQLFFQF